MHAALVLALIAACSSSPATSPPNDRAPVLPGLDRRPSDNAPRDAALDGGSPATVDVAVGSDAPPYSGPPHLGPCTDAHGCKLVNRCGCDCEARVIGAPELPQCFKVCRKRDPCRGYTLICDLTQNICGAIPPAPGATSAQ